MSNRMDDYALAFGILAAEASQRYDDAALLIDSHPNPRALAHALADAAVMLGAQVVPSRPVRHPSGVVKNLAYNDLADAAAGLALEFYAVAED